MEKEKNSTLISTTDYSAAACAKRRFEQTGKTTSPYQAYPERESYKVISIYERADGTRYQIVATHHRWGHIYGDSDFAKEEIPHVAQEAS